MSCRFHYIILLLLMLVTVLYKIYQEWDVRFTRVPFALISITFSLLQNLTIIKISKKNDYIFHKIDQKGTARVISKLHRKFLKTLFLVKLTVSFSLQEMYKTQVARQEFVSLIQQQFKIYSSITR